MPFLPVALGLLKGAAIGGAVGAGTAALTGGDVGRGATLGAVGGGALGGLGSVGSGAAFGGSVPTSALGRIGAAAHNFNQGLAGSVGLGSGGFGGASRIGTQVGQGLLSAGAQGLLNQPARPSPQQSVQTFSSPSPVARVQQARVERAALTEGSLLDIFQRGLT